MRAVVLVFVGTNTAAQGTVSMAFSPRSSGGEGQVRIPSNEFFPSIPGNSCKFVSLSSLFLFSGISPWLSV